MTLKRKEHKILFVADTLNLNLKNNDGYRIINVFPSDQYDDNSYRLTYKALKNRAALESSFVKETSQLFSTTIGSLLDINNSYLDFILKPVYSSLTSFYFDRAISLVHRLCQFDKSNCAVAIPPSIHELQSIDEMRSLECNNFYFNQQIIYRLAKILGVNHFYSIDDDEFVNLTSNSTSSSQKNLLFSPVTNSFLDVCEQFIDKLKRKIILNANNRKASYTSLGLSGDDYWLIKNGFYGPFGIFRKQPRFDLVSGKHNHSLRKELKLKLSKLLSESATTLISNNPEIKNARADCEKLGYHFSCYLADYIPSCYLEGLKANINVAVNYRKRHNNAGVIGTDTTNDATMFIKAATKLLGGTVINVQHGGYYGYTKEISIVSVCEYATCDRMVTWGWKSLALENLSCKPVPLPSPRLSCKPFSVPKFSKKLKSHDVLFLPSFQRRFSPALSFGRTRPDFNYKIQNTQQILIAKLCSNNISIHLKPYSMQQVELHSNHYRNLDTYASRGYQMLVSKQKGLSPSLISNYSLLLWDTFGTGVLDCLVLKIPCMILWEKIYSEEAAEAEILISQLEEVGVLHRSIDSLTSEIKSFLAQSDKWFSDLRRRNYIDKFCQYYAKNDVNWSTYWKATLKELH